MRLLNGSKTQQDNVNDQKNRDEKLAIEVLGLSYCFMVSPTSPQARQMEGDTFSLSRL